MDGTPSAEGHPQNPSPKPKGRVFSRAPFWIARVAPFVLSALLYSSVFFAVFSPLPLLAIGMKPQAKKWLLPAIATNCGVVIGMMGLLQFWVYAVTVLPVALILPLVLKKGRTIESAAFITFLGIVGAALVVLVAHSQAHQLAPWEELTRATNGFLDQALAQLKQDGVNILGGMTPEEWKHEAYWELPWFAILFTMVLVWVNLVLVLRINPGHVRERLGVDAAFFRNWKAPEFLVIPTIVSFALYLLGDSLHPWVGGVAQILFKSLMAIYALQGLSVLSFFFVSWSLGSGVRSLLYTLAMILMLPLVLSLGFFDLWFDFRSKFRQT